MDLQAFGVKFDNYYLESSLYADGKVEAAVQALVDAGKTYEQDGALWLRTTDYGDDKDRVMRKSDGTYTYFVPDVAYHIVKFQRGFDQAINVQGSDHHGTIARVRAGLQAVEHRHPAGLSRLRAAQDGHRDEERRGGQDLQARRLLRDRARPDRMVGQRRHHRAAATPCASSSSRARPTPNSCSTSTSRWRPATRTRCITCSTPMRASARVLAQLGRRRGHAGRRRPVAADRAARSRRCWPRWPRTRKCWQRAQAELGPHQVAFYLRDLAGELHSYYFAEAGAGRRRGAQAGAPGAGGRHAPGAAQRPGADRRLGAGQDVIVE